MSRCRLLPLAGGGLDHHGSRGIWSTTLIIDGKRKRRIWQACRHNIGTSEGLCVELVRAILNHFPLSLVEPQSRTGVRVNLKKADVGNSRLLQTYRLATSSRTQLQRAEFTLTLQPSIASLGYPGILGLDLQSTQERSLICVLKLHVLEILAKQSTGLSLISTNHANEWLCRPAHAVRVGGRTRRYITESASGK